MMISGVPAYELEVVTDCIVSLQNSCVAVPIPSTSERDPFGKGALADVLS